MSQSKFKVGDKVRYVKAGVFDRWSKDWAAMAGLTLGGIYKVVDVDEVSVRVHEDARGLALAVEHFELANDEPTPGVVVVADSFTAPKGLPTEAQQRKDIPVYSGFIKYFPLAIAAVAELSRKGNDQHNPGKPLHWDRSKSGDELDAQSRHLLDMASTGEDAADTDNVYHATKNAWRSMANLQKLLERKRAV
jgi:hypothetical protein